MGARAHASLRPRLVAGALALALATLAILVSTAPSGAATAPTTVSVTVPSATNLDGSGCLTNTPNVTDFGTVLPATSNVTSLDCNLTWGSSNDSAMLRVYQQDLTGTALGLPAFQLDTAGFGTPNGYSVLGTLGVFDPSWHDIARQADGKLVVVGEDSQSKKAVVARYNTDGTLDTAGFNSPTGYLLIDILPDVDIANAVELQADGKILVAGTARRAAAGDYDLFVARVTTTGTLDTATYASPNGFATLDIGGLKNQKGWASYLQPDGKLLVVGDHDTAGATFDDNLIARYTTSGALDTATFGAPNGYVTIDHANRSIEDTKAVTELADGRIVTLSKDQNNRIRIQRLNPDGSVDTTFNSPNGNLQLNPTGGTLYDVNWVTVLADGSYLIGGSDGGCCGWMFLAHVTAAGALDTTGFAAPTGYAKLLASGTILENFFDAQVLPDGRILVEAEDASGTDYLLLAMFKADGTLDTSYASGVGYVKLGTGGNFNSRPAHTVMAPDGSLYVAGDRQTFYGQVFHAIGINVPDYVGGTTDWTSGTSMFGACLRAVTGASVTGVWTVNAGCPASNGAWWNAIPINNGLAAAKVAQSPTTGLTTATASLRFGFRASANQPPGRYTAPLIFEVDAPNV